MDSSYFQEYKKGGLDYIKLFDYEFRIIELKKIESEYADKPKLIEGINDYLNGTNGKGKKTEFVKSMENIIENIKCCYDENSKIDASKIANLFCQIKVKDDYGYNGSCVYVWNIRPEKAEDSKVVYVGETATLQNRINSDYGKITPRNVFKGGQSTDCKMNHVAKENHDNNNEVRIYYMECNTRNEARQIEKKLIGMLNENGVSLFNYHYNKLKKQDEEIIIK